MLLAIIFDSVGAGEWLVLLAVLLVVIGPKNLPSTLRKMGNYYAKFRRAADNFKRQLMDMDRELERSFDVPPPDATYTQPPIDENQDEGQRSEVEGQTIEPETMTAEPETTNPEPETIPDGNRPDQQA